MIVAENDGKTRRNKPMLLPDNDEFVQEYMLYLNTNKFKNRLKKHVVVEFDKRKCGFYKNLQAMTIRFISLSELSRMTGLSYEKIYHMYREGLFKVTGYDEKPCQSKNLIMIDLRNAIEKLFEHGYIEAADRVYSCLARLSLYLEGLFSRAIEESGVGFVFV